MAKGIKLTEKNNYKLQSAIDVAQDKCKVRLITVKEIYSAIEEVEKKLETLMYKKDWTGFSVEVDINAQTFPHAYKGIPESTHFVAVRTSNGWNVTIICRARTFSHDIHPRFTEEQKEKMVSFLSDGKNW